MTSGGVKNILIVGADAVAWMAAAALSKVLRADHFKVQLLQPQPIVAKRFCESTDSQFPRWLALAGIAAPQFLEATRASINLGSRYLDWAHAGGDYVHSFGPVGARLEGVAFHQHWLRLRQHGVAAADIQQYSFSSRAALAGRFAWPAADARSMRSLLSHGFSFEAARFIRLLRSLCEARGVSTHEGVVRQVRLDPESGAIKAIELADGATLKADFFIDCTAAPQLLLQGALQCGVDDWRRWLPCDRALVMRVPGVANPALLQQSTACAAGWRWLVPGQSHGERGYAWCSELHDEHSAVVHLRTAAGSEPAHDGALTTLHLQAGRPRQFWLKNCLALTAGSIAPMDDLRLHLAHTAIARLLALFPAQALSAPDAQEYNRLTIAEHERARDLMILHFWHHGLRHGEQNGSATPPPDSLAALLELFTATGRLAIADDDFVSSHRWLSVLLGQGLIPRRYDPIAETVAMASVQTSFARLESEIGNEVARMPSHQDFLQSLHERQ